jgi:serine/threonine protein kinase
VEPDAAIGWRAALAAASGRYTASLLRAPRPEDPARVGPYRIEAVLGFGGMGRVFLAHDTRDEAADPVAVKVLTWNGDATAVARFRRELAAARLVVSEGTARVLDGDPLADPPWLATEYITGPTLDRLVAELGPISAEAAAGLAVGVAKALAAIHAAGVVHRDLKPSNIILPPDGPRVVDFGIARTADGTPLTMSGWSMGTPGYMAPEQVSGDDPVGPPADVFALGAVLAFATTGQPPYSGDKVEAVLYRLVNGSPELSRVPETIRPFVADCMARAAQERPTVEAAEATGLEIVEREGAARAAREQAAVPDTQTMASLDEPDELDHLNEPAEAEESDGAGQPAGSDELEETADSDALDDIVEAAKGPAGADADLEPTQKVELSPDPPPEGADTPTAPVYSRLAALEETAEEEAVAEPEAAGAAGSEGSGTPPEPTRGQTPSWRRRAVALSVGACLVLGLGGWFAAQGLGHGTNHAVGGATHSATASAPAKVNNSARASASPTATFGGGSVVAGPGCAASPFATFAITAPGSLETDVDGGDPACGRQTDAFRKSGSAAGDGSSAVWSFTFRRPVTCTLSIFIAAADPSSGLAVYKVTADATSQTFEVNQALDHGTDVMEPALNNLTATDGNIRLTLTDISVDANDTFHVTASSVTATCRAA